MGSEMCIRDSYSFSARFHHTHPSHAGGKLAPVPKCRDTSLPTDILVVVADTADRYRLPVVYTIKYCRWYSSIYPPLIVTLRPVHLQILIKGSLRHCHAINTSRHTTYGDRGLTPRLATVKPYLVLNWYDKPKTCLDASKIIVAYNIPGT